MKCTARKCRKRMAFFMVIVLLFGLVAPVHSKAAGITIDASFAKSKSKKNSTVKSEIVIDGYYEDWQNIDQKNAITWNGFNGNCKHDAGIFMDDSYVYVHVKMHELYNSHIPVDMYQLRINGDKIVSFNVRYPKEDGTIDYGQNVYQLPLGTTKLGLFYNDYPNDHMGEIAISRYTDQMSQNEQGQNVKNPSDELEFKVSKKILSKITGIPEESISSVAFHCNNMGNEWVSFSGTPTGAYIGVMICLLFVVVVNIRRKRKQAE